MNPRRECLNQGNASTEAPGVTPKEPLDDGWAVDLGPREGMIRALKASLDEAIRVGDLHAASVASKALAALLNEASAAGEGAVVNLGAARRRLKG